MHDQGGRSTPRGDQGLRRKLVDTDRNALPVSGPTATCSPSCREIGQAQILLEPANLRFAVTDSNGKFELCEVSATSQVFQQIAKIGKRMK